MYAGTGISTDSARKKKAKTWARWMARQCKRLFEAKPMPELAYPEWKLPAAAAAAALLRPAFAGAPLVEAPSPFVVIPEN